MSKPVQRSSKPDHLLSYFTRLPFLRDLFGVWTDTRLIVLTAQIAAVYAAVLIPFKVGIPLIPGFAELRPANAIPIVASLLFGPAAAWGSGIGNLIGDCFGTLGPASAFGFLGNFAFGYVPYLLWGRLGPLSSGKPPMVQSFRQAVEFGIVCVAAAFVCAVIVGWGVELLGLLPFRILMPAIFINNVIMGFLLAPPLLYFLYPRVTRWGLRYQDIHQELRHPGAVATTIAPATSPEADTPDAAPPMMVSMQDVSFTYAGTETPALDGVSLDIRQGELVLIMGRSGVGKSTLCYALNGLVPHLFPGRWSGTVRVQGRETTSCPVWEQAATVGMVFQDFDTQLISTNVELELAYPLEHLGYPLDREECSRRIVETLKLVGLAGLEARDPLTLSGGQRQRLVIGSILVRSPTLLVLDEPFSDLDASGRRRLATLLSRLKATGTTIVLVEHDPEELVEADRVCLMDGGRIAWQGTLRELLGRPMLLKTYGIKPPALAAAFSDLDPPEAPLSVDEAWRLMDVHGLILDGAGTTEHDREVSRQEKPSGSMFKSRIPVLELAQVSLVYPDQPTPALADLTLTVSDGEFLAIIGQNGSGKSTLAKLLNGLLVPTSGTVLIQGQGTHELGPAQLASSVGYVFQNPDHQIFADTVEKEVGFGAQALGYTEDECARRVSTALQAVGLDEASIKHVDPFSLTKGDRQRVAVASILAARPRVLVFDEPTTGLDGEEAARLLTMIRHLNEEGHTIIMITHSLPLVAAYARRCLLLHRGRLLADGPTQAVLAHGDILARGGLSLLPVTQFARRWGVSMVTADEVRRAMRKN